MKITAEILYEYWVEQKNLRRLFPEYRPREELAGTLIHSLTRAELTKILLYKLSNHFSHRNEMFKMKVIRNRNEITLTTACTRPQMRIIGWQSEKTRIKHLCCWPPNLSCYALTEGIVTESMR